jgi:hypothetical protein
MDILLTLIATVSTFKWVRAPPAQPGGERGRKESSLMTPQPNYTSAQHLEGLWPKTTLTSLVPFKKVRIVTLCVYFVTFWQFSNFTVHFSYLFSYLRTALPEFIYWRKFPFSCVIDLYFSLNWSINRVKTRRDLRIWNTFPRCKTMEVVYFRV